MSGMDENPVRASRLRRVAGTSRSERIRLQFRFRQPMHTDGMREIRKTILASLFLVVIGSFSGCGPESAGISVVPGGGAGGGGVPGTGGWSGSGGNSAPDQMPGGGDGPNTSGGTGGEGMPNDSGGADVANDGEATALHEDAAEDDSPKSTDSSAESSDGPPTGPINSCPATVKSGASCATPDQFCSTTGGSGCICLLRTWYCT
jgi:hypothetical protein